MAPASDSSDPLSEGEDLSRALECLESHGCVAFPTETVWGLAACALSETALGNLRAWKGRSENQPISLIVPGVEGLADLGFALSPEARHLIDQFWPGPLTLVLDCNRVFPDGIAREDGAVGLRCSPHPIAHRLAQAAHERGLGPLTATSLNRSGEPAARNEAEARELCGQDPGSPYLLSCRGWESEGGSPSTVFDLTGSNPEILRAGAIPAEKLYSSLALRVSGGESTPPSGEQQE